MEWKAPKVLRSIFSRDHEEAALSRRDMLAGMGLAGLLVAAPTLFHASTADAGALNAPAVEPEVRSDATAAKVTEDSAGEGTAADKTDVTELSAHRRWRRRHWRRRYWRRRYWRRRYYWRRPLRRRYWRRRYYRRVW